MDLEKFALFTGGIAVGVGIFLLKNRIFPCNVKSAYELPKVGRPSGDYKMVLGVRQDLSMGKGKIAAQEAFKTDPTALAYWHKTGMRKIVVKVPSEDILEELYEKAVSLNLVTTIIHDAGHTQVAPGSQTVIGIGPGPCDVIDSVTGRLSLL